MKSILFVDKSCPKAYELSTLTTEGLGGTEASVIRIVEGLAAQGFRVSCEQGCRTAPSVCDKYQVLGASPSADLVVALRDPALLPGLRERFPKSRIVLWAHDLPVDAWVHSMMKVKDLGVDVIAVSDWHKGQIMDKLLAIGFAGEFKIRRIYNPIDEELQADDTQYDPNQLLFSSSPHKGLGHALELFERLRGFNPDFRLVVCNPGYYTEDERPNVAGVTFTGPIPHSEVISLARRSLCAFLLNPVFPETFGLVFAEANAVGCPVLTHSHGAAREVVDLAHWEIADCRNPKQVIDRIMAWHKGDRPFVRGRKAFRLSRVLQDWKQVIGGHDAL